MGKKGKAKGSGSGEVPNGMPSEQFDSNLRAVSNMGIVS